MREGDYMFDEGLVKGLRRFETNLRNVQSLLECHNWAPAEQGLEPHEEVKLVVIGTTYDQTP